MAKYTDKAQEIRDRNNMLIIASLVLIPLLIGVGVLVYPRYIAPAETNATMAFSKVYSGEEETIYLASGDKEMCYWITPTFDNGYYLEIKKYNSTEEQCYGDILERNMIKLGEPVNMRGDTDCICSSRVKITKSEENGYVFLEVKEL